MVVAGSLGDYVASPNPKKIEQRRTVGSGSRSDCQSKFFRKSMALLVPDVEVVHQTTSSRPSFYIFSKVSSTPFKFTLVDPQLEKPIVEKNLWISSEGIKQIVLPESVSLDPGKIYLWYVAIPCQNQPEEYYEVLTSAVERVSLSKRAIRAIARANTNQEIAATYAINGIWYNALEYAAKEPSDYLEQLLFSAGISNANVISKHH